MTHGGYSGLRVIQLKAKSVQSYQRTFGCTKSIRLDPILEGGGGGVASKQQCNVKSFHKHFLLLWKNPLRPPSSAT